MKSEEFCLAKHFQVVGRRDLYVLPVAVNHRHLFAKSLHNRRVVGETLAEGLGEGAAQEGETEGLWGLHNAVVGAQHVVTLLGVYAVLIGMAHIAQRVDDRQHRDGDVNPARLMNAFIDSEEQREVSSLFNATIHLETPEEQNRAFSDAVIRIKDESLKERNRTWDPTDIQGLQELVKAKKELEELGRKRQQLHISFE